MKKLTIVIPAYNEAENIQQVLRRIEQTVRCEYNVNVVCDTDSDTTIPPLKEWMQTHHIPVALIRNRYGRGALNAIKTGMESAEGEYIVITMADLSDPPEVINAMVEKADTEDADIVCASRYMHGGSQQGGPLFKGLLSRFAGLSLYWFAGVPVHDSTNSFKLYRKSFLMQETIESTGGFELGIELVVKAFREHRCVCEVPTVWRDRTGGKSNFRLWKWLPSYLHWYFLAFRRPARPSEQ